MAKVTVSTTAERLTRATAIAKDNNMSLSALIRDCANAGYTILKQRGQLK